QRRLPKIGFTSRTAPFSEEVRLHELERVGAEVIDLLALKAANVVGQQAQQVKVIASGEITKAVTLKGIKVTKGARAAIEKAGGTGGRVGASRRLAARWKIDGSRRRRQLG